MLPVIPMILPIQALLARLSAETGVAFTLLSPDTIEFSVDDVFKLAALVDLAQNPEPPPTQEELMRERVYGWGDTVMGQPRERVAKDLADKRTTFKQEKLAEPDYVGDALLAVKTHKLAEAGRKSWVTRRANAAKKTKGGRK